MQIRHFKESEFKACSPSCKMSDMDEDFLAKLDDARDDCGLLFILNSAYRSPAYDKSRGRTGCGFHTKGRAVDIKCRDSASRARIIYACLRHGLSCGVSPTFIHIDNRGINEGFTEPIVFLY